MRRSCGKEVRERVSIQTTEKMRRKEPREAEREEMKRKSMKETEKWWSGG